MGHSITLELVAWGLLKVNSDWVETATVISIGVSALLNIHSMRWLCTEVLAGLFDLMHGMGFAGLLFNVNAPLSLLGLNLGIEAAQLLVLMVWVLANVVGSLVPDEGSAWVVVSPGGFLAGAAAAFRRLVLMRCQAAERANPCSTFTAFTPTASTA